METITLESVSKLFHQWRSKRATRTEPIPDELWQQALALYPQNKRSIICQQLRLSSSQFNQRLANHNAGVTDNGFVLASSETVRDVPVSNEGIELWVQGAKRNLKISVSVDLLERVLPYLGALL